MPRTTTGRGRGGQNVKLRPVPTPVANAGDAPPDELERAWWDRIWSLGQGWIAESDGPQVRMVAETLAERDRIRAWLAAQPIEQRWYVMATGRLFSHPAVAQLRELDVLAASWLGTLGFTPQSRAQLKLDADEAAKAMAALRDLRGPRAG